MNTLSLAIFETTSISEGYSLLNSLTQTGDISVVDAFPIPSGKFLIVASGPSLKSAYTETVTNPKFELANHCLIESPSSQILPAMHGLSKVEIIESLVVVESGSVALVLSATQQILNQFSEIKIIEIKPGRASGGKALVFLTGSRNACDSAFQFVAHKSDYKLVRATLVAEPTDEFLKFFNLSGRS